MFKLMAQGCAITLVTGCTAISEQEMQLYQAQIQQPTFEITCPESGCNFSRFAYKDPRDKINLPTNGYDVINSLTGSITNIALGVAPYYAISSGFKYMTTNNSVQTNSSDNSIQSDNSDNSTRSEQPLIFIDRGE